MLRLKKSIDELFKDRAAIERAIRDGVRAALLRHYKLGQPIAIWRDGKVVIVPPEEIPAELERSGNVTRAPAP